MYADLPKGFPYNTSDKDLSDLMSRCSTEMSNGKVSYNSAMGLYYREIIQISLGEFQRRSLDKLMSHSESSAKITKRLTKITISLAVMTIALTLVTIWFAYNDSTSDLIWQKEQIKSLNQGFDKVENAIDNQTNFLNAKNKFINDSLDKKN